LAAKVSTSKPTTKLIRNPYAKKKPPTAVQPSPPLIQDRVKGIYPPPILKFTPAKEWNIEGILKFIKDNPITVGPNDVEITHLHMNTSTYEKKKEKIELEFFSSLACHNTAFYLAEKIPDPVNPSEKIYRLYVNCRSPKAPHKKKILNWALCIFSTTLVKKEY
jgi:hypothetical protein